MPRKMTHAEHVAEINKVNPDVEIIGEIKGNNKKVLCRCKICGHKWEPTPANLKNDHGCPKCAQMKRVNASINATRLTHAEQVAAIEKINPNIEVLGEIKGSNVKVLCRCKICLHEWEPTPANLKKKQGCPECAKIKIGDAFRLSHDEQVEAIKKVNPNVEILGQIIKDNEKVLTRCKICGHEWPARPSNLKNGCGCPRCAKYGFKRHNTGKLYIMVDDLNVPTMMKIGVSVREDERSKKVLKSAHKAGVTIPSLYVAKTWEGPTELMIRIEQMMHENYEEWNIKFPTKFDGYKEFFLLHSRDGRGF